MDAENTASVTTIKHIRLLRSVIKIFGVWPGEVLGEKISFYMTFFRKEIPIQFIVLLLGLINNIVKNFATLDFIAFGDLTITSLMAALTIIYDTTDTVSHCCTSFMITMMILTVFLFNGPVLFYNAKIGAFSSNRPANISYYFAVHFLFPGYDPDDHFILTTFVNIYFSFSCAFCVGGTSSFIYLMIFQIIAHIKVLIYNIEHLTSYDNNERNCEIEKPSGDMYTVQHNRQIFQRLKECVEHHRSIVRFTADVSKVFGPLFGINYGYQLISCCLLLFECATGQIYAIARFGPIAMFIFGELVLVSVMFEIIKVESDKLSEAIYNVAWELMDLRNQRMVLFVLLQIQKPIFVTALGMTTIGVQTMAKVLKTTFSYFIILQSVDF